MQHTKPAIGHLCALFSILIWGTTFISTKVLLSSFTPIELMLCRFTLGSVALLLAYPKPLILADKKQEWYFVGAGLCGVTLYFIFENIALTITYTSNISVIISTAPFFTAVFAHFLLKKEKFKPRFFVGFIAAIMGIALVSYSGATQLKLNPLGDILALLAAMVWSLYCIINRKITAFGYNIIQTTRRGFYYGILFMLPCLLFMPFSLDFSRFAQTVNLLNILYLGLGASALCFVTWNLAVRTLGAVRTSVYIYLVPVVTIITSAIVLHERITPLSLTGTALTLAGLFISQGLPEKKKVQLNEANHTAAQ